MTTLYKAAGRLSLVTSILLLITGTCWSYSSGPPDGVAGNPPLYVNCTFCHNSFAVNSGDGTLQLLNLPAEYEPDMEYTITVSISDPGQSRWGFEMTVLDASLATGGSLTAPDATSQVSPGPPQYAKHTAAGTQIGEPSGEWDITWTAPSAGTGTVDFYLAGNAANNNLLNTGDYIYTITTSVTEVLGINDPKIVSPESPVLVSAYPNPFNPVVSLNLNHLPAGEVNLSVIDVKGRVLQSLNLSSIGGTDLLIPLDLTNVPSGQYFIRTAYSGGTTITPIVKLK